MADFIQVHNKHNDCAMLINLNWVEEIVDYDSGPTIFFSFPADNSYHQDYIETKESFDDLFNMIRRYGK